MRKFLIRQYGYLSIGLLALVATSCHTTSVKRDPDAPTRIALLSDVHVNHGTNAEARLYMLRFQKALTAVNASKVDLVLMAGDLTEHGTPGELADFRRQARRLEAPVFFVPGNHDVGNKRIPGKSKGPWFGRMRDFQLEVGPPFFARECAGVRVIGLNSGLLGSRLPGEARLWRFLEGQLDQPAKKPTLVLLHHPPFLKSPDEAGGDYFNLEPYPRARLLALSKQGGVSAILSGHLHQGLTNRVNGMVLLTTPPISFGLPKGKQSEGWTLLTVQGKQLSWEFQPLPAVTEAKP